jgi:thiol:disulfide interchange protein
MRHGATVFGAAVLFLSLGSCDSTPTPRVQFSEYDGAVLYKARESGKPTIVYVTTTRDAACQAQNRGALQDPKVIAALETFNRLKDDVTTKHPSELALIGIGALPIFDFYDSAGQRVNHLIGTQSSEQLIAAAQKAAEK